MKKQKAERVSTDYIAGRREWLERYGSYIASARNWRTLAFGSVAVSGILALGMVHEASQTHVVPYVVQVDKLGQTVEVARAVKAGTFEQPVVTHILARFVTLARSRLTDGHAEKAYVDQAYALAAKSATDPLNSYFKRHDPFAAYTNGTGGTTVQITSILPVGKPGKTGAFQIDWIEKAYNADGTIASTKHWQGIVNYAVTAPPSTASGVSADPFGVYVTGFSWNPVSQNG